MRLRQIRVRKGLTQVELAELAGLSQSVIASLEGRRGAAADPKWSTACRIAYALGERPEDIFGLPLHFKAMKRRNGREARV